MTSTALKYSKVKITTHGVSKVVRHKNHRTTYPTYISWLRFLALIRDCGYNVEYLSNKH